VRKRSTVTNATPHLGKELVVNLDLADFFPSVTFPRVRGMFERMGYSPAVATVLALLCTESPRRAVEYDGRRYWVAVGPRALPQGACTSPALSNLVARKLDRRLAGMCAKHGWTYTRYADDLTFSGGREGELRMFIARVRHIVQEEGFALNSRKGRIQRASGRQQVTGIVVNAKPGMPRDEVRRLRAILHAAKKTGLAAQNKENRPNFEAWLRGKIAYLMMIDRKKGAAMLAQLDALKR
jgi:retron-type reverse transcriptase